MRYSTIELEVCQLGRSMHPKAPKDRLHIGGLTRNLARGPHQAWGLRLFIHTVNGQTTNFCTLFVHIFRSVL